MRATLWLVPTLLWSCSQTTGSPAGPLPRPSLVRPAGQTPALEGVEARFEATLQTCSGTPFDPASIKVSWVGVKKDAEAWLRDVQVDLLDAPEGLVVELAPTITLGGASLEANAPWVDVADVALTCTRRRLRFPRLYEQSLKGLVQLKATGDFSVDGSPWTPAAAPGR